MMARSPALRPRRLEHVGEAAHQPVQFLVGDHALIAGLAFPEDGDLVLPRAWSGGGRGSYRRRWSCRRRTTWRTAGSIRTTCVHFSNQCSSFSASSPQNSSGCSAARSVQLAVALHRRHVGAGGELLGGFENFVPRHSFDDEFSKAGRIADMGKTDWNRPATYEDANLILRLYEERREEKLREARAWFVAECKPKSLAEWQAMCPSHRSRVRLPP